MILMKPAAVLCTELSVVFTACGLSFGMLNPQCNLEHHVGFPISVILGDIAPTYLCLLSDQ
ncbi:hypothetical protein BO83DRAFT_378388 [Aspergillus eucalypticola CBS 122712]|uniref:Uncharacterized protein n=1 Tax=Aspergillus eucalypticola (strain CBS 122712 / IBT 29274) TaxID=1448314 RepID=A0A317VIQ8_ASPEC|nr:uncharacterized protein BO83DRAFT_378388 [Aspergillus eucalypticola CBS 122712]PWY73299.1 hypothetical protein BO83DRAFT_378388 [Aspergillus eucalypticola CBS 122712]